MKRKAGAQIEKLNIKRRWTQKYGEQTVGTILSGNTMGYIYGYKCWVKPIDNNMLEYTMRDKNGEFYAVRTDHVFDDDKLKLYLPKIIKYYDNEVIITYKGKPRYQELDKKIQFKDPRYKPVSNYQEINDKKCVQINGTVQNIGVIKIYGRIYKALEIEQDYLSIVVIDDIIEHDIEKVLEMNTWIKKGYIIRGLVKKYKNHLYILKHEMLADPNYDRDERINIQDLICMSSLRPYKIFTDDDEYIDIIYDDQSEFYTLVSTSLIIEGTCQSYYENNGKSFGQIDHAMLSLNNYDKLCVDKYMGNDIISTPVRFKANTYLLIKGCEEPIRIKYMTIDKTSKMIELLKDNEDEQDERGIELEQIETLCEEEMQNMNDEINEKEYIIFKSAVFNSKKSYESNKGLDQMKKIRFCKVIGSI